VKHLGRLHSLQPLARREWPLVAVLQAACAEGAALLWDQDPGSARRLLGSNSREQPGLRQLLDSLRKGSEKVLPEVWHFFESWPAQIDQVLSQKRSATEVRERLLPLAGLVGY